MKIAFVNDFAQQLGVQSIVSVLQAGGHQVKIFFDPMLFDDDVISIKPLSRLFDLKKALVRDLKAYQPDLIGFSVVTDFYQWACSLARMIKKEMDVPIIFGGIHPTSVPERVIKNDFVDMVCVGEGEYPMLELADSMDKGALDFSIRNLWFKKDGQVISNDVRPLIQDLDSLPRVSADIYFSKLAHFKRAGMYVTMTSRGCPYACSYCCHSYLHEIYRGKGSYIRQRSIENVIQELVKQKRDHKTKFIYFMDNCFGYDLAWLKGFSERYAKEVGVRFGCVMHPRHVSPESVKYLKKAGCHQIDLGIQSWRHDVRKALLNRDISNSAMEEALALIKKEKILLMTDVIFDLPHQEERDVIDAARRYIDIQPNRIFYYMLRYYPRTALTQKVQKEGFLSQERVEEIEEGIDVTSFVMGGEKTDKNSLKFQILFYLIDLLPRPLSAFLIHRRLDRYFPTFLGPALIVILRNLFAFDMNARFLRSATFHRYGYFSARKCIDSIFHRRKRAINPAEISNG